MAAVVVVIMQDGKRLVDSLVASKDEAVKDAIAATAKDLEVQAAEQAASAGKVGLHQCFGPHVMGFL